MSQLYFILILEVIGVLQLKFTSTVCGDRREKYT